MGDLIVAATNHDLEWMKKVHRPDELLHTPLQIPPLKNKQGLVLVDRPHGLCVRGDVACCHVGQIAGVVAAPSDALAGWVAMTFFHTQGLQPVELLTRDGFERMVRDAKRPAVELCPKCGGSGMDRDAAPEADGAQPACPACEGEPQKWNEEAAAVQVGPVRVLLHELRAFLPYLGGSDIGLGVAPSVGRPGQDLHIRHVLARGKKSTWGDWRITVTAL